ncbi:MAG: transporter substrate-binding domain-containing protein, partial [Spirochaetota bacterium]
MMNDNTFHPAPRRRWRRLRRTGWLGKGVLPAALLLAAALLTPPAAAAPPVSSAAEVDYPPFSIVGDRGRAEGFSVELLRAALKAMGREVTFRTGTWPQVRGWLERGEVQALPLVGRTPEREAVFDFTFPYMSLHGAIVVREDNRDIRGLADLRGRQVAVMRGDNAEEFLRREERGIDIRTTATFTEALRELAGGRHDAVVMQRLVALRLLQETGIGGLRVVDRPVEGFRQDFCFAVREGDKETLALLNEGLALVMADGTYRRLHARWFAALQLPAGRRILVGGDHSFPPYEYLDKDGNPAGFAVELTRAIAREMDLDIEIRLEPWDKVRRALERGEIDVIQGMFYSPERDLSFDFTQP